MKGEAAALLAFEDVCFGYGIGGALALRDFSMEIESGTVTSILGPNGAGKTTLLHLALGWLAPSMGRVVLEGRPLRDRARRELGRFIAIVPQSERLTFQYSVLEYVALGRAPYLAPLALPGPADLVIAEEALARAGIAALARRDVTALSGGERQLAAIARALAQKPRLLLLDEPTSHLDLANKARLLNLVLELKDRGTTVIFTSHELETAAAVATHAVLMRGGHALARGTLAECFTTERLSETYGLPVEVVEAGGRRFAAWTPVPGRADETRS